MLNPATPITCTKSHLKRRAKADLESPASCSPAAACPWPCNVRAGREPAAPVHGQCWGTSSCNPRLSTSLQGGNFTSLFSACFLQNRYVASGVPWAVARTGQRGPYPRLGHKPTCSQSTGSCCSMLLKGPKLGEGDLYARTPPSAHRPVQLLPLLTQRAEQDTSSRYCLCLAGGQDST